MEVMRDFHGRWGIAGGWAIDLYLGHETRAHHDVDIAVLREDQAALRRLLEGVSVTKVVKRELIEWAAGETLAPPIHEIHATWPDESQLEFLLDERQGRDWVYRRDARIRLPMANAFLERDATPFLAPEVVLLYKSKGTGPKDDDDFQRVVPRLGADQRGWLRGALLLTSPDHHWLSALEEADEA